MSLMASLNIEGIAKWKGRTSQGPMYFNLEIIGIIVYMSLLQDCIGEHAHTQAVC